MSAVGSHRSPSEARKAAGEAFSRVAADVLNDRAALATLRRGVGRTLEDSPSSWPYIVAASAGREYRERAAHVALSLLALHQQSFAAGNASQTGWGLGRACRVLAAQRGPEGEKGVARRFRSVLAADDLDALSVHLRGLLGLLRGAEIPLDYTQLFLDLSDWGRPERRSQVGLRWSRDYLAVNYSDDVDDTKGKA